MLGLLCSQRLSKMADRGERGVTAVSVVLSVSEQAQQPYRGCKYATSARLGVVLTPCLVH